MMPKPKQYEDYKGKVISTPSKTVPDQTMSMRKLMERYAQGLPLDGHNVKDAHWDEESNGINPKILDLVDLENIREHNENFLENVKKSKQKTYVPQTEKADGEEAQQ